MVERRCLVTLLDKVTAHVPYACCLLAAWSCSAGEPIPISGTAYQPASFTNAFRYALRNHETQQTVAVLDDPRGLLAQPGDVLLQTLSHGAIYGGLPILEVIEVLPESWAQLVYRAHYAKGFGAATGENVDRQSRDYAGAPYSFDRAYDADTARLVPGLGLTSGYAGGATTPRITLPVVSTDSVQLRWFAEAGLRYDIRFATDASGPFSTIDTFISQTDTNITVTVPMNGSAGFYQLRAGSTVTP